MIYQQVPVLDTAKYFFQLDGIRTVNHNDTTGAYTCIGILKIIDVKTQLAISENDMTYTVGLTDDKKSLYITIHDE